jgi:putative transposase
MAEYQVSYVKLHRYLQDEGVIVRSPGVRPSLPPATPAMIADYEHMSLAAVAEKHDVSRDTLPDRLRAAGVRVRGRGRERVTRLKLMSNEQWEEIADLFPVQSGRRRPFSDARLMVEGIVYRSRCGIGWRSIPAAFGPATTVHTWYRRMSDDGTWDILAPRLLDVAETAGTGAWTVSIDPEFAQAHRTARVITRTPDGWISFHGAGG